MNRAEGELDVQLAKPAELPFAKAKGKCRKARSQCTGLENDPQGHPGRRAATIRDLLKPRYASSVRGPGQRLRRFRDDEEASAPNGPPDRQDPKNLRQLEATARTRRGGRAVECTGLENRQGLAPFEGSNPSLSAIIKNPPSWRVFNDRGAGITDENPGSNRTARSAVSSLKCKALQPEGQAR